ncbi:TonB-dependent receptor [Sesbania bispinosa]|nr:TonB-dependent receptor [Sesbania bispinosa]
MYLEHYPHILIIVIVQAGKSKVKVRGESPVANTELVKEEIEERGFLGKEKGINELIRLKPTEVLR